MREVDTIDGRTSVVEIKAVQEGDYAAYNCKVVNSYGEDTRTIELERKGTRCVITWISSLYHQSCFIGVLMCSFSGVKRQ